MAELFLARVTGDGGFDKACVIKRVLPHLLQTEGFIEMFLDEARLAARLNHPGIVQIFDLGRVAEDYYLAMEYLAGEDLNRVLSQSRSTQKPLPLNLAVQIIAQAAEALHYAHEASDDRGAALGIVHRDVSLANLLVTYQGTVKLLDFGIAKAEHRLQHTQTGQVKGKVGYMAPEQALGLSIDRRADVWSLGVCLHELLSGRRLFGGATATESLLATQQASILPPSVFRPEVPPALDAVVMRALTRDPALRWPTARALRSELVAAGVGSTDDFTVELGAYLCSLFGSERAERSQQRGRHTDIERGPSTALLREGHVPHQLETLTERTRPARRWRPLIGLALGALFLAAAASAYLAAPAPVAPPTSAPPAPVAIAAVAPELQAVEALSSTSSGAPGAPVETATPPVAKAPRRPAGAPAVLWVESEVPAVAWLDGKSLGELPFKQSVSAGRHRLTVTNTQLSLTRVEQLQLIAGQELHHRVRIARGKLNIDAQPWADVWMDGVMLGQTPLAGREAWEGRHVLRLLGPHSEKTVVVQVVAGETSVVQAQLP